MNHKSVLTAELIRYLKPKQNQNFIDATLGLAGHAKKILPLISPKGRILGIDWDSNSLSRFKIKVSVAMSDDGEIFFVGYN